jgi:hypothetical protein
VVSCASGAGRTIADGAGDKFAMKTYPEQLKDPRWQKKRLKILERDNFTCRHCDDTKNTLHVHHLLYAKGVPPWNYPNQILVTLCERCHEQEEKHKKRWDETLAWRFRYAGATNADIERICLIMKELNGEYGPGLIPLLECFLSDQLEPDQAKRIPRRKCKALSR